MWRCSGVKRSMNTLHEQILPHKFPTAELYPLLSSVCTKSIMSTHTIQSGDTFTSVASKNNTTAEALERANPGVNPNNLQVGQVIQIGSNNNTMYTIKQGDTLST